MLTKVIYMNINSIYVLRDYVFKVSTVLLACSMACKPRLICTYIDPHVTMQKSQSDAIVAYLQLLNLISGHPDLTCSIYLQPNDVTKGVHFIEIATAPRRVWLSK